MKADSPNWVVMGEPVTPAEAAGLDALRELLPDNGSVKAWVNLTFLDTSGRSGEIDVLLLTMKGLFVVELKGWHSTVTGNQQRWWVGNDPRPRKNPVLVQDAKAKRLSSLLKDVSGDHHLAYVDSVVVMHGKDSKVDLPGVASTRVVALDCYNVKGGLPLFSNWLAEPAAGGQGLNLPRFKKVRKACEDAGFQRTPQQRKVGQYVVEDTDPIASGPDWQDFVVAHPVLSDKRRLRLYDMPPQASAADRAAIEQTAQRELKLTEGVVHEGIEVPLDLLTTDSGPALLFGYDPTALPLDGFLAAHGRDLDFDTRVALVRELGEILHHAHTRRLVHRALAPARVWVHRDGKRWRLRIRDWYAGRKAPGTTTTTATAISGGVTDVMQAVADEEKLYLAPEALHGGDDLPTIPLDVYGFGALAFLVLTGHPPASSFAELQTKFQQGFLDPHAVQGDLPDPIADVIRFATSTQESMRTATIDDVLAELERAVVSEQPETPDKTPPADPIDAEPGDALADRFLVESRRGQGSTGTALVVLDMDADDERPLILKLGRSDAAAHRLEVEAEVLAQLDHPRIVRLVEGPLDVDGRMGLLLTDAGDKTLAGRIAAEGRATLEQLERYGHDLLEAVAHLDARGVFHRDIKPANLAVAPDPGSRKPRLTLFDLSLAREPLHHITSGTPGYLDPYLGRTRRRYDRPAELWSVAATLFEMATGSPVWWADGAGPLTPDEAPVVVASSFEDSVADAMAGFFQQALHPQAQQRHGNLYELAAAWRAIFAALEAMDADSADGDEGAVEAATLATPLIESGLSARALSGVARLDVTTVGALLGVPPYRVNQIPGLGERYRKEIQGRVRGWRARLAAPTQATVAASTRGVEGHVRTLLHRASSADRAPLEAVLGVYAAAAAGGVRWPTLAEAAATSEISPDTMSAALDRAAKRWTRLDNLEVVASDLIGLVQREGRVMTLHEAAAALGSQQGSQLEGAERLQHAAALIRGLVEVELRADLPRLFVRRTTSGPSLLALEATVGDDGQVAGLDADLLVDQALRLGARADALVAETGQGVVAPAVARAELRALLDTGIDLTDERLVRLAAACSTGAAASTLGELYSRDLPMPVAIEHALRGRPGRMLTEMWVRRRVFSRFPELRGTVPSHPALDPIVEAVLPGLTWDGTQYAAKATTEVSQTMTSQVTTVGVGAVSDVDRTLRTSIDHRSALALTVQPRDYLKALTTLSRRYVVDVVDVGQLLVEAARERADADEIDQSVLFEADAAARDSFDWDALTGLVQDSLGPRWDAELASDRPLLIVHAGPLVRYGLESRLSDLLDVGTRRPAARWLLVAQDASAAVPQLEGRPVPLGPSGAVPLPTRLDLLTPLTAGAAT